MTVAAVLRWLLELINAELAHAEPLVSAFGDTDYHGPEAIDVTIAGSRFRIRVEAIA